MQTYLVDFYRKVTDDKGKTREEWAGNVEVSMLPHETITVAAKAFRHASDKCSTAHRIKIQRVR